MQGGGDALGKDVYNSASLGVRTFSFLAQMSRYDHDLWNEVANVSELVPADKWEDVLCLVEDGREVSRAVIQGAYDSCDTAVRGVATGVSIRRQAWLKGSGFSVETQQQIADLPFSGGLLFVGKIESAFQHLKEAKSTGCLWPLYAKPSGEREAKCPFPQRQKFAGPPPSKQQHFTRSGKGYPRVPKDLPTHGSPSHRPDLDRLFYRDFSHQLLATLALINSYFLANHPPQGLGEIDPLEEEVNVVTQMYQLIEQYNVPAPPEDFAFYATVKPSIAATRNAIDKSVGERDVNVEKFCQHLDKDIQELNKEVKEVKQLAQDPQILDISADKLKITQILKELQATIDDLQKKAFQYKSYQKNFKVEVTKFDALEEVSAELKLKQLLWDSSDEWDVLLAEWMQCKFDILQPEQLNSQVSKYAKFVSQLEKGLPPNSVVPKLKQKVETMKEKLPIISDLRNPCMKPRHWEILEETVGAHLVDIEESLSLAKLIELNAFSFAERIQEVSGQASGEASLETILKKVEDSWKTTEFIVLSHRDSKDVFILGGTDEIQVLLDDSTINIATIASSRYVGPIKSRVDEWQKQLSLFSQTLDEWLTCQKNWLYLESIFSAPDIQRQLPAEAKMFLQVDKSWKEIMRKVNRLPNALRAATQHGLLENFQNNNSLLDQIQKCLEAYLESKRVIFPRFYFLSNDELLEILAQTRNPQAVQPHLRKCFDSIVKLEFALAQPDGKGVPTGEGEQEKVFTNDILAMLSPEKEKVSLGKGLKARGNVEEWLGKVEEAMFLSLRRLSKAAISDYQDKPRMEWVVAGHPSQVVLTVSQLMWCRDLSSCLEGDHNHLQALATFEITNFERLNSLAGLVRGYLPPLHRNIITALITVDVHARDIVSDLVKEKVDTNENFEWQRQLRYYWDLDLDNCVARMALSRYIYGYEYLGACPRLVITPLTLSRFMFEGREIKLVMTCAAFITMNPGYAGRTELPDNLKALFRPIAMMVPNYALIAEVILYSEGFESSKILARKMTQMYKLCSEQLSQQDHYDFGMRAVKSVLVMAGALKRENPNLNEDVVLIRALRDSNLPKFLTDDAELFSGILSDLFPGVVIPDHNYGSLQSTIVDVMIGSGLQSVPSMIHKVIQLYETMLVRHGVMIVGPTGGGKTTVYKILADALGALHAAGEKYPFYQPVKTFVLNPKSITMGELYGEVNNLTLEWKDGLMALSVRTAVNDTSEDHKWIISDGPVDALWIENMNTVLDDNKMLCLANSERIKLTSEIHMVFEVQDLKVASPATVSRCGMVYVDPEELKWMPYVQTWMAGISNIKRPKLDSLTPTDSTSQMDLILQELVAICLSNTEIYNEIKGIKANIIDLSRRIRDSEAKISSLEDRTEQD
nr:PREDICTED: dynein heavy chain 6, axonemal-like [Latimeria chalumnae]|eukprot:XP_014352841.1 PREDICTED: dynein heavy chain 6, axonemal-like [Latimeria chalumnae]